MGSPLVTVFMPVYDREDTLREAIESVLAQTFEDFELLILDDGSTDGSVALAESIPDPRIRIECNPRNLGQTPTRNRGVALARGRYVAMLDSDDTALPRRLALQVAFLDAHPDHGEVGSWVRLHDDRTGRERVKRHPTGSREIQAWLPWRCPLSHSSVMIRADLLKRLRYDERFVQSQDYDLHVRIAREAEVANLPVVTTVKRVHEGQVTQRFAVGDTYKMRAIAGLLREIGLSPTDPELERHFRLTRLREASEEDVVWADAWLDAVLDANAESRRLPAAELEAVAAQVWLAVCWKAFARAPHRLARAALSPARARHYPAALSAALRARLGWQ